MKENCHFSKEEYNSVSVRDLYPENPQTLDDSLPNLLFLAWPHEHYPTVCNRTEEFHLEEQSHLLLGSSAI